MGAKIRARETGRKTVSRQPRGFQTLAAFLAALSAAS